MKKYILAIATTLMFLTSKVMAGGTYVNFPVGSGVDRSTVSFSSSNVFCFSGVGQVVGFVASSNTAPTDYLIFRDTGSLQASAVSGGVSGVGDYLTTDEFARVYLSSTAIANPNVTTLGFSYRFPEPIYVYKGLTAKANVTSVNIITILWRKLEK